MLDDGPSPRIGDPGPHFIWWIPKGHIGSRWTSNIAGKPVLLIAPVLIIPRAAPSPRQREKPFCLGPLVRVF